MEEISEKIVHGLWNGLPLCRFTWEPPGNWPAGNFWTLGWKVDVDEITCVRCRTEAEFLTLQGQAIEV